MDRRRQTQMETRECKAQVWYPAGWSPHWRGQKTPELERNEIYTRKDRRGHSRDWAKWAKEADHFDLAT